MSEAIERGSRNAKRPQTAISHSTTRIDKVGGGFEFGTVLAFVSAAGEGKGAP